MNNIAKYTGNANSAIPANTKACVEEVYVTPVTKVTLFIFVCNTPEVVSMLVCKIPETVFSKPV